MIRLKNGTTIAVASLKNPTETLIQYEMYRDDEFEKYIQLASQIEIMIEMEIIQLQKRKKYILIGKERLYELRAQIEQPFHTVCSPENQDKLIAQIKSENEKISSMEIDIVVVNSEGKDVLEKEKITQIGLPKNLSNIIFSQKLFIKRKSILSDVKLQNIEATKQYLEALNLFETIPDSFVENSTTAVLKFFNFLFKTSKDDLFFQVNQLHHSQLHALKTFSSLSHSTMIEQEKKEYHQILIFVFFYTLEKLPIAISIQKFYETFVEVMMQITENVTLLTNLYNFVKKNKESEISTLEESQKTQPREYVEQEWINKVNYLASCIFVFSQTYDCADWFNANNPTQNDLKNEMLNAISTSISDIPMLTNQNSNDITEKLVKKTDSAKLVQFNLAKKFERTILKKSGESQHFDIGKCYLRLLKLAFKKVCDEPIITDYNIRMCQIIQKIQMQISDEMNSFEIDNLIAEICYFESSHHPDHELLAAFILVSRLHKYRGKNFAAKMQMCFDNENKEHKVKFPLISQSLNEYAQKHSSWLQKIIDYDRDYIVRYFGIFIYFLFFIVYFLKTKKN